MGKYGVGDPVYLGQWPLLHSATLTDPTDPRTVWRITVKQGTRHETQTVTGRACGCNRASGWCADHHAERGVAVQRRPCVHEGLGALRGTGEEVLRPITFVLRKNGSLGLEKQYFEYMSQGKAVDYAIVSPAHMSTFSKAAPFIDAPFLFRDLDHWNKVLDADLLKPVADEINQKAEVMLIGYAGGGTRNIFANKPVKNMPN